MIRPQLQGRRKSSVTNMTYPHTADSNAPNAISQNGVKIDDKRGLNLSRL